MPGPKPDTKVAFEQLYHQLSRLGRASSTAIQHTKVRELIGYVRAAELLWHEPKMVPNDPPTPPAMSDEHYRLMALEADAGWKAFKAGQPISNNPHTPHSAERTAWDRGWLSAQEAE